METQEITLKRRESHKFARHFWRIPSAGEAGNGEWGGRFSGTHGPWRAGGDADGLSYPVPGGAPRFSAAPSTLLPVSLQVLPRLRPVYPHPTPPVPGAPGTPPPPGGHPASRTRPGPSPDAELTQQALNRLRRKGLYTMAY